MRKRYVHVVALTRVFLLFIYIVYVNYIVYLFTLQINLGGHLVSQFHDSSSRTTATDIVQEGLPLSHEGLGVARKRQCRRTVQSVDDVRLVCLWDSLATQPSTQRDAGYGWLSHSV